MIKEITLCKDDESNENVKNFTLSLHSLDDDGAVFEIPKGYNGVLYSESGIVFESLGPGNYLYKDGDIKLYMPTVSNTKTLKEYLDLLNKSGKFVIPSYQRGYVWGQENSSQKKNSVENILDTLIKGFREKQIMSWGIRSFFNWSAVTKDKDKLGISPLSIGNFPSVFQYGLITLPHNQNINRYERKNLEHHECGNHCHWYYYLGVESEGWYGQLYGERPQGYREGPGRE